MIVYRLSKKRYRGDLSGKGAELAGGRWNSVGNAVLYTAENRALCAAEIAVHTPLGIVPQDYFLVTLEIPKRASIRTIKPVELPEKWRVFPYLPATLLIGDQFLNEGSHLVLKVPSAVIPGEFNYLINPRHPDFRNVKLLQSEPFEFDQRMFGRK